MKSFILFTITLCVCSHIALCQDTTFTQKDFDSSKVYYKVSKIPDNVKSKIKEIEGEWFKMANTGGKWEAGDAITNESLPRRKLICFIVMPRRYILCYEQGGYSTRTVCYMFLKRSNELEAFIIGIPRIDETYKSLKEYMLNNKVKLKIAKRGF
jgi:hypothetical protein